MKNRESIQFGLLVVVFLLTACAPVENDNHIVLGVYRGGFKQLISPYVTYVIRTEGSGETAYALPRGLGDSPEWSPDGKWIVFTEDYPDPNNPKLYLMTANGKKRILLNVTHQGIRDPVWSPDGSHIVYYAYDDKHTGIYILKVDCILQKEECSLQPTFLTDGYTPDWSHDGKIAYQAPPYGLTPKQGIFVIYVDESGEPINLTPGLGLCFDPSWSPDGMKLVFSCDRDIYTINADGSNIVNLTEGNGGGNKPKWSPDGNKILFVSDRNGLGQHLGIGSAVIYSNALFMMNPDGSDIVRLSQRDDEDILWYSWIP